MTYEVRLANFSGPFDLLCHLIEKAELDICAVSLAEVVDQYLQYIKEAADATDLDAAGDFLVMAARLLLLKARVLLPAEKPTVDSVEEESPEELVDHLRQYKRFREAAEGLAEMMAQEEAYVAGRGMHLAELGGPRAPQLPVLDLAELAAAWLRVAPLCVPPKPVAIIPETPTVEEELERLSGTLRRVTALEFSRYLGNKSNLARMAAAFLALLELWHREQVTVWQRALFDEIIIAWREEKPCG
ncbi:MAG: segregation and condensation protein A [bacterium]